MKSLNIALLGLGTVGTGIVKSIQLNQERWQRHFEKTIEIKAILVRDLHKKRNVQVDASLLTYNYNQIWAIQEPIDVLIEVIGGVEPAKTYIMDALLRKCHVVTANKELMAKHGEELLQLAAQQGVHLLYEASVGGGIPILGTVRNQLQFNRLEKVYGIVNGTTNYILTQMTQHGKNYEEALREAQLLGYAEADPTSDVEGYDALYKLIILARETMGFTVSPGDVHREGISSVTPYEIVQAAALDCRIKLIASIEKEESSLSMQVTPTLVAKGHPLFDVNDVYNAVYVSGNLVGDLAFIGRGAGEFPTASAVLEDVGFIQKYPEPLKNTSIERSGLIFRANGKNQAYFVICESASPILQEEVEHILQEHGVNINHKRLMIEGGLHSFAFVVSEIGVELMELLSTLGRIRPILGEFNIQNNVTPMSYIAT